MSPLRLAGAGGLSRARARVTGPAFGTWQLIFDGQSFNTVPAAPNNYPSKLLALLPAGYYDEELNAGVGSTTYADREVDVDTRVDDDISVTLPTALLDMAGQSDLWQSDGNMTAAALLAAAQSYADDRIAAGVDLYVIATVPPSNIYSGPANTQRDAYNELLRDVPAPFAAVLDIDVIPEASNPSNGTYYSDGLHPTAALAQLFAERAELVLGSLGLPTA